MRATALLFLASFLSIPLVACGGAPSANDGATTNDGASQDIKALTISDSDNGKSVDVVLGRSFTIALSDDSA